MFNKNLYPPGASVKVVGLSDMAGPSPGPGPVLVAVSGGADSVAMLRLLADVAPKEGWRLHVGHVDHGLRAESSQDAEFVLRLAQRLDLPCHVRRVDVDGPGSPEENARNARRRALLQLADECGGLALALAHTMDDQAETVLARLLTGSGPTGLAAMRARDGLIWRPLLGMRRDVLRDWLKNIGQAWREDASNADPRFQRNRIRNSLIPLAEEMINPRSSEALSRFASLCAEEEDYWRRWCDDALEHHAKAEGPTICLRTRWLAGLEPFQARRILRRVADHLTGVSQHLLYDHLVRLGDLLDGPPGRTLSLPADLAAWREHGWLRLGPDEPAPRVHHELREPGEVVLPHIGAKLLVKRVKKPEKLVGSGALAWLPEMAIAWPLVVRTPQTGEVFHPLGAPGSKRLSKVLIDKKVPQWWRKRLVLVADEKGSLWAGPLRLAQRAAINVDSEPWIELSLVDTKANCPYSMQSKGSYFEHNLLLPTWAECNESRRQAPDKPDI